VDIAYKVIAVPVKFVVVIVSALIRAELLVGSSLYNITTIKASLFHDIFIYIAQFEFKDNSFYFLLQEKYCIIVL